MCGGKQSATPLWTTFLHALYKAFGCSCSDVTQVKIETRRKETELQRKTTLVRNDEIVCDSSWNTIRRANP